MPRMQEIATNSSHPLKTRFAARFMKSLLKVKNSYKPTKYSSSSPSSSSEIWRRSQRIKLAAYSSMARAVGSRRAWSRALILKLRARKRARGSLLQARSNGRSLGIKRKRSKKVNKSVLAKKRILEEGSGSGVSELRRLVPGGESMDLCSLLEETAHFVRCLDVQVRVMKSIADRFPC